MKAKLIKREEGYYLFTDESYINAMASNHENWIKIHDGQKLSIKNCEAIELGYDLDELAEEYNGHPMAVDWLLEKRGFKAGLQKALEILGDKKFSENDMRKAIAFGWDYEGLTKEEMLERYNFKLEYDNSYFEDTQKYIQSLQQNEWAVIVETVGLSYLRDKDDCLILKRI